MTQSVTLSFREVPDGDVDTDDDDISFVFTTTNGERHVTERIPNVWSRADSTSGDQEGLLADIRGALQRLPNFAIDDIDVSLPEVFDADDDASLSVTFSFSGEATPGNQLLLDCPTRLGCPFPGCQPRYGQLRIEKAQANPSSDVQVARPFALEPLEGFSGVRVAVVVSSVVLADTTEVFVFSVTTTQLNDEDSNDAAPDTSFGTLPVPLKNFDSTPVDVGFGVRLQFTTPSPQVGNYEFEFHLAQCSSGSETLASTAYEALECAGRGTCNRDTGLCSCFTGHSGHNCASTMPTA